MLLATYENVAAWMAMAQRYREMAQEAETKAFALLAWALAHPDQAPEMNARELRRWIAQRGEEG